MKNTNPNLFQRVVNSFTYNPNDTPSKLFVALTNLPVNISPGTCNLYGYNIYNPNTNDIFIKVYDSVAAPSVGVDTPVLIIQVSRQGSIVLTGPDVITFFENGLWIAATKNYLISDNTAPAKDVYTTMFFENNQ